ncbi:DUF5958 family protein [Streptomyces iakyrus]|uniref:DUF5958 family protein n=1 Tax=Streptomyces iakyrus TaxID=68219 RepID=UPI0033AA4589
MTLNERAVLLNELAQGLRPQPLHVLGLADARRRERYCADGCGHDWHQLGGGVGGGAL